jgi:hypothetical protein
MLCNGFSSVFKVFLQVLQTHVLSISFVYVVNVSTGYFKSRSGVAAGDPPATASGRGK